MTERRSALGGRALVLLIHAQGQSRLMRIVLADPQGRAQDQPLVAGERALEAKGRLSGAERTGGKGSAERPYHRARKVQAPLNNDRYALGRAGGGAGGFLPRRIGSWYLPAAGGLEKKKDRPGRQRRVHEIAQGGRPRSYEKEPPVRGGRVDRRLGKAIEKPLSKIHISRKSTTP